MTDRRRAGLGTLERVLAILGAVCLVWYAVVMIRAARYQREQSARLEQALSKSAPFHPAPPEVSRPEPEDVESPTIERSRAPANREPDHAVIGRLEIPRLHLSVMVVNGDDDATLKVAAGHLPDTPLPWEFGNSAVAGHRDSFFRPLSGIKINDQVRLTTPHGEFHYAVASTRIVEPNDLSVLAQTGHSSLTLVTCYPFAYVGRAPKRFIVRADHIPS